MKLFIIATIVTISSAALLPSKTYLPQAQTPSRPSITYLQPHHISGSQGTYHQAFGHASYEGSALFSGSGPHDGNKRPQQQTEKIAAVLKHDQDISENGFHYSYETSNGIRAEESGNSAQTKGGFSYKGDDGITYSIVFTAGEGGFLPQGDHIPVPPPIPQAILEALEKNAKDEAAGIYDDGKYRPNPQDTGKPSSSGSSFASGQSFGSSSHQETFNGNTGYRY